MKDTDSDLIELRKWMAEHIRGLRDDRSTASYALEFLRTTQNNLKAAHERVHLQIVLSDARKIVERIPAIADHMVELEKNQTVIPWND